MISLISDKPVHQTDILPLRWFANFCELIAHFFLDKYLYWDNSNNFNKRAKLWAKLSQMFYAPYIRWGTFYVMSDQYKSILNMAGAEWSDYDENGHPYWDYEWHTGDPADDWRLLYPTIIGKIHTDGEIDTSMKGKDLNGSLN